MRVLEFQAETTEEQAQDWRQRQSDGRPARLAWAGVALVLAIVYLYAKSSPLKFDPGQLYFGTMTVGTESSLRVRVINTAGSEVTIADITPFESTGDFSIEKGDCVRRLAANGECSFMVRFRPTAAGAQNSGVKLISDSGATLKQLDVSGGGIGNGSGGKLRLNTTRLDFGENQLGEAESAVVMARNEGQSPLDVWVAIRNENRQFAVRDGCGGQRLDAGENCEVKITYSPAYEGLSEMQMVVSDSSHVAQAVAIRGIGKTSPTQPPQTPPQPPPQSPPEPPPTATQFPRADYPEAIAFDLQRARFDRQSRDATIRNSGQAPLVLQNASLNGQGFTKEQDTCSGKTLAPNDHCNITVAFASGEPGNFSGNVSLATNAPSGSVNIALSGTATAPGQLWISRRQVDFGTFQLDVGTQAAQQSFLIANTGGAKMQLARPELQSGAEGFSIDASACPGVLAAGSRCEVTVTFLPGSPGASRGSVLVRADGDGSPQAVSLSGVGVASPPLARMIPSAVDFGRAYVGRRSSAKPITVQSYGRSEVAISGLSIDGENGEFLISRNGCGPRLGAGESCTVQVLFIPRAEGRRTAALVLNSNSANAVQSVRLTGVGYQRVVTPPPPPNNGSQSGSRGGTQDGVTPSQPQDGVSQPPPSIPQSTCWQPTAKAIDFELLTRTSDYSGKFRVKGIVTNQGTGPGSPDPANIQLLANSQVVAQTTIRDLSNGDATLTYDTDFSKANEFPPTYSLVVTFGSRSRIAIRRPPRAAGGCSPNSSRVQRPASEMGPLLQKNNILQRGLEIKRIPQPVQPQIK